MLLPIEAIVQREKGCLCPSVEAISQQTHMCHGARLSPYNWVFISWVITHLPISSTNSLAHLSMIPSKNGKQQWKRTIHFLHMLFCSFTLKRQQLRVVSWIMFPCDKKMFVFIYFCYLWFSPTTITHAGIDRTWSRPILNQAINYSRMMSTCFCEKAPPQHTNIFPDWAPKNATFHQAFSGVLTIILT